jgi:hypothetical protein
MFTKALLTSVSRARQLWLVALLGLVVTGIAAASAQASATPAGDAVIASAGGTTIDTTSGSAATAGSASNRSSTPTSGNALTLNNTTAPTTAGPSHATSASRQVGETSIESPIVGLPAKGQSDPSRAALAQIQSAGPIVAYSGTVASVRHTTRHNVAPTTRESSSSTRRPYAPKTASSTIEINAHGVKINLNISPTNTRRPTPTGNRASAHPTASLGEVDAPTGLAGLVPTDPRPAPAPGGPSNTTLYGSGSGSSGGMALLGVDSLLAIAVLLVGAAWRRRSWDLPVLPRQSALLSLALDRPG